MEDSSKKTQELQLVIFKIGKEEFGVAINQVREIVRLVPITPVPKAPVFVEGVVNLRGQILAVVDLATRLSLKGDDRSEKTRIIVVEVEGHTVGMIVDEVTEVLRLASESIDQTPELIASEVQHRYLEGVGKIGDRLLILIDLAKIFSAEEVEDLKEAKVIKEKEQEKEENTKEEKE
jgi:purine-binding chemotaxis protein CheW